MKYPDSSKMHMLPDFKVTCMMLIHCTFYKHTDFDWHCTSQRYDLFCLWGLAVRCIKSKSAAFLLSGHWMLYAALKPCNFTAHSTCPRGEAVKYVEPLSILHLSCYSSIGRCEFRLTSMRYMIHMLTYTVFLEDVWGVRDQGRLKIFFPSDLGYLLSLRGWVS